MTLQFPRYSKDGHLLSQEVYDKYSLSWHFVGALDEYYKPLLPSLSDQEVWKLAQLVQEAFHVSTFVPALEWDKWVKDENIPSFWTKESATKLTEAYIARIFPLLEPPALGEKE